MSDASQAEGWSEDPPQYYRPVCVREWFGFLGGPAGYERSSEEEAKLGPVILERRE